MPFDATGFPERRKAPRRPARDDASAILIIVAVAFSLLVMPVLYGVVAGIAQATHGEPRAVARG